MINIRQKLRQNYSGATILITGHTGFKGGWLSLWLESLGAKVIGYSALPPTDPSFFKVTHLDENVTNEYGDINDYDRVSDIVSDYQPNYIFHLAAQPLVRESYLNPKNTFNTNIMGTVNILEAIRVNKSQAICICVTSDKCYENQEWDYAYRESDPMGGHDPYSASKGAAEIVISSYRRSFLNHNNKISSVRAGNVIGGGDWATDRIVPDCIKALSNHEKINVRNPFAIRPWQLVLEPLLGYLWLAHKMTSGLKNYASAWNFGPNYTNCIDVKTLTEKIIANWGCGEVEYGTCEYSEHEATLLKLDIAKAVTRLRWKPLYDIDETIKKTVNWYKRYYNKNEDMYEVSLEQILAYESDANKQYD